MTMVGGQGATREGLLGRLHKEEEVSVTRMCLQIPVNSRLAIVRDALESSECLSAQFQCTFLCI